MKKYLLLMFLLLPGYTRPMDLWSIPTGLWSIISSTAAYVCSGSLGLLSRIMPFGATQSATQNTSNELPTQAKTIPTPVNEVETKTSDTGYQRPLHQDYAITFDRLATQENKAEIEGNCTLHDVLSKELPQYVTSPKSEKLARAQRCKNMDIEKDKPIKFVSKMEYWMEQRQKPIIETIEFNEYFSCKAESTFIMDEYEFHHVVVQLYPLSDNQGQCYQLSTDGDCIVLSINTGDTTQQEAKIGKNEFFNTIKNILIKQDKICLMYHYDQYIYNNQVTFNGQQTSPWHNQSICFYKKFSDWCDKNIVDIDQQNLAKEKYVLTISMTEDQRLKFIHINCDLYDQNYKKIDLSQNAFFKKLIELYVQQEDYINTHYYEAPNQKDPSSLRLLAGPLVSNELRNYNTAYEPPFKVFIVPADPKFIDTTLIPINEVNVHGAYSSDKKIYADSNVTSLVLRNGILVMGHANGTITLWNIVDGTHLHTLLSKKGCGAVYVGFNNDGILCYHYEASDQWYAVTGWTVDSKKKAKLADLLAAQQEYPKIEQNSKQNNTRNKHWFRSKDWTEYLTKEYPIPSAFLCTAVCTAAGILWFKYPKVLMRLLFPIAWAYKSQKTVPQ